MLALVTWAQRDDPHWYGGRIPGKPLSVEFVQISIGRDPDTYSAFQGEVLAEAKVDPEFAAQRMRFILSLEPVPLP